MTGSPCSLGAVGLSLIQPRLAADEEATVARVERGRVAVVGEMCFVVVRFEIVQNSRKSFAAKGRYGSPFEEKARREPLVKLDGAEL